MGDEQRPEPPDSATNPPPRASWWHERRGLLATGLHSPSRFPSGVLSGEPGLERPGTRYSGGAAPDLHRLPSIPVRVIFNYSAAASLPACLASRKGRLELGLESAALRLVRVPLLGRGPQLLPEVAGIQRGNRVEQPRWCGGGLSRLAEQNAPS